MIDLASKLILLIAVYQLADGIQNVSVGVLRGIQDVKIIMPIAFLSYIVCSTCRWVTCWALHWEWAPTGLILGFTVRSYDGRRTADRPLPPRYPALEGRHPIIRDLRFPAATPHPPGGNMPESQPNKFGIAPGFHYLYRNL